MLVSWASLREAGCSLHSQRVLWFLPLFKMEASGYESLVGLFRKLVVPFGDGGLFFSYWADFVGEIGSVLWGSKERPAPSGGVCLPLAASKKYSHSFYFAVRVYLAFW